MTIAPDGHPFPPLLTDFTCDHLGVPRNKRIPGYPEADRGPGNIRNMPRAFEGWQT